MNEFNPGVAAIANAARTTAYKIGDGTYPRIRVCDSMQPDARTRLRRSVWIAARLTEPK